MLLEIREKAQGWFAWLIVAFITIPFALWGIQSYIGVGTEPPVAVVNDTEIKPQELEQRFRLYRERIRQQLGEAYRPELFDEQEMRQRVLDQLIDEALLKQAAEDWNMRIGDDYVREYIRAIPVFQINGQFSVQAYQTAIRNQGLSQRGFEERVRESLILDQFQIAFSQSAIATDRELNELIRLREQQRKISYIRIPGRELAKDYQPSEDEIKAYYEEHINRYMIPERVKLEYILISPDSIGAQIEVNETLLKDYFEQHQEEFQVPEERKLRHILVTGDDAQQKAEQIKKELAAGKDFAELAKQYSEDPGSKDQGGDLGWVSRGMMVKPFEEAAFQLAAGQISEPVKTEFGYHIIQLVEIKNPAPEDIFEQLKPEIEKAYRRYEAEKILFDQAEKLADLSYEMPDSLHPAAEELGLEIQTSDWLDRRGGQGIFAINKVIAAAFSDDVLKEGNNSELLELDDDQMLVLRVLEHEDEQSQPLDQVKEQVIAAMKNERARELAKQKGEALLQALQAGEADLPKIAEEQGWKLEDTGLIKRNQFKLPANLTQTVFKMPRPEEGQIEYAGTELGSDYALIALSEVKDGDPSQFSDEQRQAEIHRLAQQKGRQQYQFLLKFLKERAEIQIF